MTLFRLPENPVLPLIRLACCLLLACLSIAAQAQSTLPTIKAKAGQAVILVGDKVVTKTWQLSPQESPDIFIAQLEAGAPQTVTFRTDLDAISFKVEADQSYDFIVDFNGALCLTRITGKAFIRPTKLEISYDYGFATAVAGLVRDRAPASQAGAALASWPQTLDRMVQKMRLQRREQFYTYLAGLEKNAHAREKATQVLAKFGAPEGSAFAARFEADVRRRLLTYVPAATPVHVRVRFVFGGYSSGFAFGGDDVYVNLADYADVPPEQLAATVAHEAMHAIQAHIMPRFPAMALAGLNSEQQVAARGGAWAKSLLHALIQEGTAEMVSRMDGHLSQQDRDLIKKNAARAEDIFTLFETLFLRAWHVPPADPNEYDRLYGLMFYTQFDATAYQMGWMMGQAIEQSDGKQAVHALLARDQGDFFRRYQEIARNDPRLPKFSAQFMAVLDQLPR